MPLIIAPSDKQLRVIKINADDKVKKHLEALGITINSIILVISHCAGSVICRVKDYRLALDHQLASKIVVA